MVTGKEDLAEDDNEEFKNRLEVVEGDDLKPEYKVSDVAIKNLAGLLAADKKMKAYENTKNLC